MLNLISLTCPNLQVLDKNQKGVFSISRFLVKSLTNKNCHKCRTNDIGMKLRPVSKLDKINMTTSKKFYDDVM